MSRARTNITPTKPIYWVALVTAIFTPSQHGKRAAK